MNHVKGVDIYIRYRSDHSALELELEFKKIKCLNFWKFNLALLKDKQYLTEINDAIKRVKEQYAVVVYGRQQLQNIALKDLQFTISDQLFLDVLSMEIRSKTIVYSLKKKKRPHGKEQTLEKEIQHWENKTNLSE